MVPSDGVQDPHLVVMLDTQRTLVGWARPPNTDPDSCRALASRAASLRRGPLLRRSSRASSRSSISATQRRSSALLNLAGISTTVRSPSR